VGILRIMGMSFYGYHGVSQAEKELGTRFEVDVEIDFDTKKASESGKLADTINYEQVYEITRKHITEKKFHLLESITESLADEIFALFKPEGLKVRVRKLSPPFPGQLNYVELEVTRGSKAL